MLARDQVPIARRRSRWLVALVLPVAAATACSSSPPPTSSGPTVQATSPNGTSAGSPTTGSSSSGAAPLAVRELEPYRFEVVSAEVADNAAGLLPPSDGNVLVAINLAVTNTSSTDQAVSTFAQLSLKLPDGSTGLEVPPDSAVKAFKDGNLGPGKRIEGVVLYEVPADSVKGLVFEMAADLSDSRVAVELAL